MQTKKYYNFVRDVAKEDPVLAEAIISAHKAVFKEEVLDEGLRDIMVAGATGLGLGLGAASAKSPTQGVSDVGSKTQYTQEEVSAEKLREVDPAKKVMMAKAAKQFAGYMLNEKTPEQINVGSELESWNNAKQHFEDLKAEEPENPLLAFLFQSELEKEVEKSGLDFEHFELREDPDAHKKITLADFLKEMDNTQGLTGSMQPKELASLVRRLDKPLTMEDKQTIMMKGRKYFKKPHLKAIGMIK